MKKIILPAVTFFVLIASNLFAQPGCPAVSTANNVTIPCGQSCTNLTATAFAGRQSTSYSVTTIPYSPPFAFNSGTPIIVNTDDIWSGVINLPFHFCFFGNSYNNIIVGSNGVCSFNTANAATFNSWQINNIIPSATPADMTNCIMRPWQDMDPTNSGNSIFYEIGGTYPCRYFKVSWYQVPMYGDQNSVNTTHCQGQALRATQQIILYETTNVIEMYIQNKPVCSDWNNGRATQGINNANGTQAYSLFGRNNAVWTATNDATRFTPNGANNYTIAWLEGGNQIGTGSTINVCPAAATTYTAQATYTDCDGSQIVVSSNVNVVFAGITVNVDSVHQISCNGGSDGAVYASFNTGSAVLSYGWSPGGAGQTHLDNIPAGTYIFSVTDASNCTRYDTVSLVNPPQLLVNVPDTTLNTCTGGNPTTNLTATASGGTPGYTYLWTGNIPGQTLTNVGAGTYIVTVTDSKNCTNSDGGTVTVNTSAIAFDPPTITDAQCGQNNGSITVSASGGIGSVTYTWNSGLPNGASQTGLAGGTYCVTATDGIGCTATACYTVNQTSAITFGTPLLEDASCLGNDGSLTVNVQGATGAVTYTWNPAGPNSDTQTGLTPGTYCVTATDANTCSASVCYTISQAPQPTFDNPVVDDASCLGNDGSITISVNNVTNPPLTYTWNPAGPNSPTNTGLAPGTYDVTATDNLGCSTTASYTVGQDPALTFNNPVVTDATCAGNDGSITVSVSNANGNVDYTWNPTQPNSASITGLTPGTYDVTATDANGCSTTASYTVGQNGSAISFGQPTIVDATCAGNNGSITVVVNGATGNVDYTWNPTEPNSASITGLASGTYAVTATDANGCSATASYNVGQTGGSLTFGQPTIVDATCAGNNGSITVVVNGATGNVDYTWNPAQPNSASITGLASGTYAVTATDANGCSATASYNVGQSGGTLTFGTPTIVDASCGASNGSITVVVNGATGQVHYNWNPAQPDAATISGLSPGTFSVTATDGSGCSASASYTVGQNSALAITNAQVNDVSCTGSGTIILTVTGGSGNLTYTWSGPNTPTGDNPATGLVAGTYNVTISDVSNCSVSAAYIVGQDTCGSCPAITTQNNLTLACGNACTVLHSAAVDIRQTTSYTGQAIPYNPAAYNQGQAILVNIDDTWSGQINLPFNFCFFGNSYTNLYVGSNGIVGFNAPPFGNNNSWQINGPIPSATPNDLRNTIMGPWQDLDPTFQGQIYQDVDGVAPCRRFVVSWYQVPMYGDPNSVSTGSCANPIFQTQQIVLYESSNIIEIYIQDKDHCLGWNNGLAIEGIQNNAGTVAYTVPGRNATVWDATNDGYRFTPAGAPAYVVNWYQGTTLVGTGDSVQVCPAATSTYHADAVYTSCNGNTLTVSDSVLVTVQGDLTVTIDSVRNVTCNSGTNGAVYASYTNTNGTVTSFGWSPGGAGQTSLTNIPAGTYIFTATNSGGCTVSDTVQVTEPTAVTVNVPDTTVYNCTATPVLAELTATATGGTPGYTYDWGGGHTGVTYNNIPAGTYTVTATDANGCTGTGSGTITQALSTPTVTGTVTNISCNGANDGMIVVTVAQATGPYTYTWNPAEPDNDTITGLSQGTYDVTVTDANTCTGSATFTITEPAAIIIGNPTITDATCTVGGTISVTATGGTGTLTYDWSNNDSGSFIDSVAAGPIDLTVTDANGCSATASYTVGAAPNTVAFGQATIVDVTCNGGNNGSITATASGGTGTITFTWNTIPAQTGATASGLTAGTYTVTITDQAGCSASTSYTVGEPTAITLGQPIITPETCLVGGTVTVTASGGTPGYVYNWSNNDGPGNMADSLSGGTVTLTVTDANNCSVTASYVVPSQNAISISNTVVQNETCAGDEDAFVHVVVTGGTYPYSYTWNPNFGNDSTIDAISGGQFDVTVTDASGCSTTGSFNPVAATPLALGNPTIVDATCTVQGSITANASGGTGQLTYTWAGPGNPAPGNPATGLAAGNYTLTVTDANSCSITASYTVGGTTNNLVFGNPTLVQPTCNGGTNGSITVTTTGGNGQIVYVFNPGPGNGTATLSPVGANTYGVTATDVNGCSATASYTLGQPSAITFGQANITHASCSVLGSVTVTATGGTAPLVYAWSNGDVGNTADSLPAGNVTVTVTDDSQCTATASYTIQNNGSLTFNAPIINNVSCHGANDGSITVSATGGSGNITYNWGNNITGTTRINLAPGQYSVTATDQGGCSATAQYTITEPAALSVTITATSLLCFGDTTGTATANATGGTGGYHWHWNGGDTTQTITGLEPGIVLVTVTDANGCTATTSTFINQSPSLSYNSQVNQPNCADLGFGTEILTPRGGTGEINIDIPGLGIDTTISMLGADTVLTIPDVPTGNYTFTLTDSLGCTATGNFFVNAGAANEAFDIQTDSTSCFGDNFADGAVSITPQTIANAPYQYSFNGGAFASDTMWTGLTAGTYTIITRNTYGCIDTLTAVVESPGQLSVDIVQDTVVTAPGVAQPVTVNTQNFVNPVYDWSPMTGVDCAGDTAFCPSPSITANQNTVYYVVVSEAGVQGCYASDSVIFIVTTGLKMPNAFTPNADGKNDVFFPVFGQNNPNMTITDFRIYNRWGQMIHNDIVPWDGKFKGADQPAGTYIYYVGVRVPDADHPGSQKTEVQEGAFSLLR